MSIYASVVYIYNATGSQACFENKNILFYFKKNLANYKAGVVTAVSKVVGLAPGTNDTILKMLWPIFSAKRLAFFSSKYCLFLQKVNDNIGF
jgi:hypothetical protein